MSLVVLVSIGLESAVFLEGNLYMSAAPRSNAPAVIFENAALSLASFYGVTVQNIEHKPTIADWQWSDEAIQALVNNTASIAA